MVGILVTKNLNSKHMPKNLHPWHYKDKTVKTVIHNKTNVRKNKRASACLKLYFYLRQKGCFVVKRYAVRNTKIRPYALRKLKM